VGRVDHDDIDARVNQRLAALEAGIAHRRGGGYAQTAKAVLAGHRVQHGLLAVLQRQKAGELALAIMNEQLLDPSRLHQAARFIKVGGFGQHGEIVARHHHADGRVVGLGKAHIAVGDDADDPAALVDHGKSGDVVTTHQFLGVLEGLVRRQGDRVINCPRDKPLHPPDLFGLLVGIEVAVNDADPSGLSHGDRHAGFGHGVHRRRQKRDVHGDRTGRARPCIGRRRQDRRGRRHKKNVVEGEGLANLHQGLSVDSFVWRFPISRVCPSCKQEVTMPACKGVLTRHIHANHRTGPKCA
jgi:hypothetical protein